MSSLAKLIENKHKGFLCLEVNPPHGIDITSICTRLEGNTLAIDFLNITDSALARMKASGFAVGAILKQRFGIEPLVNISCRDRNIIALQAEILGANMLGINAPVALTGDAISLGDHPDAKGVFEINSIGLLDIIAKLNSGTDAVDRSIDGIPKITPGVVVNPNAKNLDAEIRKLKRKVDHGAKFALSQPVFDIEIAERFVNAVSDINLPIMLGLLPIKSKKSVKNLSMIPGITISQTLIKKIEAMNSEADIANYSLEYCYNIVEKVANAISGIHVVSGVTPKLAIKLTAMLRKNIICNIELK
jgi:5,10-methylenetetrahydrofolate reductase